MGELRSFYGEEKDNFQIQHVQDIRDVLLENKIARDNSDENWAANKDWKHVARIPITTYMKLTRMGINPEQDPKAFFNWLKIEEAEAYRRTRKKL